jgi:hypothetical protein
MSYAHAQQLRSDSDTRLMKSIGQIIGKKINVNIEDRDLSDFSGSIFLKLKCQLGYRFCCTQSVVGQLGF